MDQALSTSPINRAEQARQQYLSSRRATIARSRPTDNLAGKEVVTQSSNRPVIVRPPLETTPMELSKHRSDTHTRVAHGTSNSIAYVTGFFDGVIDSLANGIAEILEDGAFFVSRVVHGAKHGWTRGKYTTDQNHKSTSKHLS